jgi:DNA polymerase III delta prime subunit
VLEEPPANAQIILLVERLRNIPPTVQSRCAVLHFKPVASGDLALWLHEEQGVSMDHALEVAQRSGGSFSKALALKDDDAPEVDLSSFDMDEFFSWLGEASWRKEGRKRAERVLTALIEEAERQLSSGDLEQAGRIKLLLSARRCLDHHVNPRLVLEDLFVKMRVPVGS